MARSGKKQGHLFGGEEENCRFCQIAEGEDKETVVYAGELTLVSLDHRPLFKGHCLVTPRKHIEAIEDVPDDVLEDLFKTVRMASKAVTEAMGSDGTLIAVNNRVSQSIPHIHVHVVPRRHKDGLHGFFWPRMQYASDDEMKDVANRIRKAMTE